jgi:hypothetical protein
MSIQQQVKAKANIIELVAVAKDYESLEQDQKAKQQRQTTGDSLLIRLGGCKSGTETWRDYQQICFDLIKLTFKADLSSDPGWEERSEYIKGLKGLRRDITILNHPLNKSGCWIRFRDEDLNCKMIVFDCKNYKRKQSISELEIYQLYGYLDPRTIGKLGVILSRHGKLDPSAKTARRRLLQDGYEILVLKDSDLEEWIQVYIDYGSVESFFSTKYREFINRISSN